MRKLQQQNEEFPVRFLRLDQVKKMTGLGRSSIYLLPSFPGPVKIPGSKCVAWVESEVLSWMQRAIAERNIEDATIDNNPPAPTGWVTGEAAVKVLESNPNRAGVAK